MATPHPVQLGQVWPSQPASRPASAKLRGSWTQKKDDQHPPTKTPDARPQEQLPHPHLGNISPKSQLPELPANPGSCDMSDPLSQHRYFGQGRTCPHPQEPLDERSKPSTHHHWALRLSFTHVPQRCAPTPPKIRQPGEHGLSHDSVSPPLPPLPAICTVPSLSP